MLLVSAQLTPDHIPYFLENKDLRNVRLARLLAIAKLNPDLTPHSLRHTHTSLLAEAGVALEQIMDRLGHSDHLITKNVYLYVTKEMKKRSLPKVQ